ncbi:MAG: transglutaminase domain-containing protein [Bacteroidota bacterium]
MNKAISTIGLLVVLVGLIVGLRFLAGQSGDRPRERNYAQEAPLPELPETDSKEEQAQPVDEAITNFSAIDKFARATSDRHGSTIQEIAAHLESACENDLEKARAIYVWLTKNIRYDDEAYNSGQSGAYKAREVFRVRKAVCEGFSNLYVAMGEAMDLEIEKVIGYSKGVSYVPGSRLGDSDHAWNAIRINGKWRVFDATWGEGNGAFIDGKLVSKKDFNDYWFNVDPYEAIFNHYPEKEKFVFVEPAISLRDYEQLPYIRSAYFKLGFDGKATFQKALSNPDHEFPFCFDFNSNIQLIKAPAQAELVVGKSYPFEFESASVKSIAAIRTDADWAYFKQEGNRFKLNYFVEELGALTIGVKDRSTGQSFESVLKYELVRREL